MQLLGAAGAAAAAGASNCCWQTHTQPHQQAIDGSCGGSSASQGQSALTFKAERQLLCEMQLCCLLTTPHPSARPTQSDPKTATAAVNLEPISVDGLRMRRPGATRHLCQHNRTVQSLRSC